MEGTQLHVYTVLGGIVKESLKEKKNCRFKLIGEITSLTADRIIQDGSLSED